MADLKQTEKDNKLLEVLFDPESIKDSVAFNASMSLLQIIGLFAFSFLGATIQFGFENWLAVIYSTTYWINVVMMSAEQFYAYNIAYQFAISVMANAPKYRQSVQKGDDIINGVFDDETQKWLITPLNDDSAFVDMAIDEMNASEREACYKKQITTKIKSVSNTINKIEIKPKPKFFLLKKWRINRRARIIDQKLKTIEYLKAKMDDKDYFNSLDDKQIKGYAPIEQAAIISNQSEKTETTGSKYGMRDRKDLERKGAFKRAVTKLLTALLLPLVAWGVVTLKSGTIVSLIVMLIMQFVSGWRTAARFFKTADVFNAEQRFKTIKEIQRRVPGIKERETARAKLKAEIEKIEIQAWEDNKKFDAELLAKKKAETVIEIKAERPSIANLNLIPLN